MLGDGGGTRQRRDTVMDLARVWVKRDERHVAKLGEWPASMGKYGRRPAARGGARPCRSPRRKRLRRISSIGLWSDLVRGA